MSNVFEFPGDRVTRPVTSTGDNAEVLWGDFTQSQATPVSDALVRARMLAHIMESECLSAKDAAQHVAEQSAPSPEGRV